MKNGIIKKMLNLIYFLLYLQKLNKEYCENCKVHTQKEKLYVLVNIYLYLFINFKKNLIQIEKKKKRLPIFFFLISVSQSSHAMKLSYEWEL